MINLRYHIVSIVAVFLALAIGIFAGSTLLDRTILEGLESRQASLDRRNDELKAAVDDYEKSLEATDEAVTQFSEVGGDLLDPTLLTGTPVLLLATRGIEEPAVNDTSALIETVGGSVIGTLWVGESADLTDEATVDAMTAAWWGTEPVPTETGTVDALTASMGAALAGQSPGDTEEGDAGEPTSTTVREETAVPTSGGGAPETPLEADTSTERFRRLVDGGHLEWEPASGAAELDLAVEDLVTVVLTGEGSDLGPVRFVYPLVDSMAANGAPVVVGEIHRGRTRLERIGDDEVQPRGYIVDRFRIDEDTAAVVTTVDNVDHPYGRLAVMMAMRDGRLPSGGAYGFGELTDSVFPTGT